MPVDVPLNIIRLTWRVRSACLAEISSVGFRYRIVVLTLTDRVKVQAVHWSADLDTSLLCCHSFITWLWLPVSNTGPVNLVWARPARRESWLRQILWLVWADRPEQMKCAHDISGNITELPPISVLHLISIIWDLLEAVSSFVTVFRVRP
jgi:hypothetical protein